MKKILSHSLLIILLLFLSEHVFSQSLIKDTSDNPTIKHYIDSLYQLEPVNTLLVKEHCNFNDSEYIMVTKVGGYEGFDNTYIIVHQPNGIAILKLSGLDHAAFQVKGLHTYNHRFENLSSVTKKIIFADIFYSADDEIDYYISMQTKGRYLYNVVTELGAKNCKECSLLYNVLQW